MWVTIMIAHIIKNILVEVEEIKVNAESPIIKVINGAHAIINDEKIKALRGTWVLESLPNVFDHLDFPSKLTENNNLPALYKKLLVDEIAALITTKLIIEPAFLIPVALNAWTNGLLVVEILGQGMATKIATIAIT